MGAQVSLMLLICSAGWSVYIFINQPKTMHLVAPVLSAGSLSYRSPWVLADFEPLLGIYRPNPEDLEVRGIGVLGGPIRRELVFVGCCGCDQCY